MQKIRVYRFCKRNHWCSWLCSYFEGAAGLYQIQPDIITYGKIIGGGLPVGMYGASEEIMNTVSPLGPVYQAGTLSGNPVAMAAGIAQLTELSQSGFYKELNKKTEEFVSALQRYAEAKGYKFKVFGVGSIFWFALFIRFNLNPVLF